MPKSTMVKMGWIVAAVVVLLWAFWRLKAGGRTSAIEHEIGFVHLILMSVLSFPAGPAVLFVLDGAVDVVYPSLHSGKSPVAEVVFVWFSCVVGGYVQWFVVLPSAYRKLRKKLRVE